MVNTDVMRIDLLLKHIDIIHSDLDSLTLKDFEKSDLLVRATCFSLVQIGEQMNKLEEKYRNNYPDVPWSEARKMRNIIVHVYNKVDAEQVWLTATKDLNQLKDMFERIKTDII